jgi:hypothetical protein
MELKMDHKGFLNELLLHFIFAGVSALILSFAYIFTDFWFVYIFALLPFLHRIIKTDLRGSVLSGIFLAVSITFVTFSGESVRSPFAFCCNSIILCFTFTAFSMIINRLKRYFALSFLLFVALCLPLEYFHKSLIDFGAIFNTLEKDGGFIFRATSLFGFILTSFLIIAVNSLLFLLIGFLHRRTVSGHYYLFAGKSLSFCDTNDVASIKHGECLPCLRGPPVSH